MPGAFLSIQSMSPAWTATWFMNRGLTPCQSSWPRSPMRKGPPSISLQRNLLIQISVAGLPTQISMTHRTGKSISKAPLRSRVTGNKWVLRRLLPVTPEPRYTAISPFFKSALSARGIHQSDGVDPSRNRRLQTESWLPCQYGDRHGWPQSMAVRLVWKLLSNGVWKPVGPLLDFAYEHRGHLL